MHVTFLFCSVYLGLGLLAIILCGETRIEMVRLGIVVETVVAVEMVHEINYFWIYTARYIWVNEWNISDQCYILQVGQLSDLYTGVYW